MNEREPMPCENMSDYVRSGDWLFYLDEPAEVIALRMSTAALFLDHAKATVSLCGSPSDSERSRWESALEAVCAELGRRIDAAQVKP